MALFVKNTSFFPQTSWLDTAYQRVLHYAEHPWAIGILALLAFSASIWFPLPPDPLFALIALQRPRQIPFLICLCAGATAAGGVVMYGIGYALYQTIGVWILDLYGWQDVFARLQIQLHEWGFWLLVIKAFTPIPYKLLALAYGVGHFNILDFVLASFLGRGARYTLEGLLIWMAGPSLHYVIRTYLKPLLISFIVCVCVGFMALKFL